jgi:hypothetical protein
MGQFVSDVPEGLIVSLTPAQGKKNYWLLVWNRHISITCWNNSAHARQTFMFQLT